MSKKKLFLITTVILAALVLFSFSYKVDYYVMRPSRAVLLGEIISVSGSGVDARGSFYLVTVTQQQASPLLALYGYFHPHMELRPAGRVVPRDMEPDEYRELLAEYMAESRHIAQVVALREAGYEVEIESEGVAVIGLVEDAPAEGFLYEDDIIVKVDGQKVFLASEVPLYVQDRPVGVPVTLQVSRGEQTLELEVPTGEHPDEEETPFLGIYIQTLPWIPLLPLEIEMDTGSIGGPSAGLMFTLEILNQLTESDLTGGRAVAGTGTMDLEGRIGRVGGIPQKVIAAEQAGVEYFFLPEGNSDQIPGKTSSMVVVPVSDLQEVLSFLESLPRD